MPEGLAELLERLQAAKAALLASVALLTAVAQVAAIKGPPVHCLAVVAEDMEQMLKHLLELIARAVQQRSGL